MAKKMLRSYGNYTCLDGASTSPPFVLDNYTVGGVDGGFNVSCSNLSSKSYKDPTWYKNPDLFKKVMDQINIYMTPVIIFVGVSGNLLSFLVFMTTHLRRQSSSVYLATLSLVDTGFLLSLLIVWFGWIKVPIFPSHGWCQTVVYVTYVCSFLSAWNVVGFTAERYIIVWHPLRKDTFCTPRKARIVVLVLVIISFVCYSFAVWTSGIIYIHTIPICMPFPRYYDMLTVMTSIDTVITLIIPSIVIVILNIRIFMKIREFHVQRPNAVVTTALVGQIANPNRRTSMQASVSNRGSMHYKFPRRSGGKSGGTDPTSQPEPEFSSCTQENRHQTRTCVRGRSQFKTARMLLVVSTIFVILNLPSHVYRVHAYIQNIVGTSVKGSKKELNWQELFQLVYHLNFAINFFLYSLCGRPFRTGLRRLCSRLGYKSQKYYETFTLRFRSKAQEKDKVEDV